MLSLVKTISKQKNYVLYTKPYQLNIWGFRSKETKANRFDDEIHVFYKTNAFNWEYHIFKATTDPGTYWLYQPMMPQGTAILAEGQYKDTYALGLHRGKYMALTQALRPVTVIRDYNRNSTLDFFNGRKFTGFFGINIHRAMVKGTTLYVDNHSAGCQVFANASDFYFFIQLCEKHRSLYGNKFTYTLVDWRAARRANARRLLLGSLTAGGMGLTTYLFLKNKN
ncbi:MAG: hypothetical protein ACOZCO_10560 [Bacteroidota bacterium]